MSFNKNNSFFYQAQDNQSDPARKESSSPTTNIPNWLEQVRAIGAVVCTKMSSQDDRISLAEVKGIDLSNLIHNNIIPWAAQTNDKLASLKEGLALMYQNMPSYLTSLNDQIQNLSDELIKESSSRLNLQEYLQNTFPHEFKDLILNQTHKLIDEKISAQNVQFDITANPKFLEYKGIVDNELHCIKAGMEDLLFMEPPTPPLTLESSIQDEIKNSIFEKIENSLHDEIKTLISNSLENSLRTQIDNLISEKIELFQNNLDQRLIQLNISQDSQTLPSLT